MKLSKNIDRMYIVKNKKLFVISDVIKAFDYYGMLFILEGENIVIEFLHGDIKDYEVEEVDQIFPYSIDCYIEIERFPHAKKDSR